MNPGVSGGTAEQGLERLSRDVLSCEPDLVIVMFSLNDMVRAESPEAFEADLLEIVRRCNAAGAKVLLCTPNSILETPERPIAKLESYVENIRHLGEKHHLPVADCYAAFEAVRKEDEFAWWMLLSDEIHPNMAGHKLIAETLIKTISGHRVSLADVPTSQPAIPITLKRLQAGETVEVLAMPPFDAIIPHIVTNHFPHADTRTTQWNVDNLPLAEIEASARQVRKGDYDLVVIALPWKVCPGHNREQLLVCSEILNKSRSYNQLEWDCIAIAPSVGRAAATKREKLLNATMLKLITNKDMTVVNRDGSSVDASSHEILSAWWTSQVRP